MSGLESKLKKARNKNKLSIKIQKKKVFRTTDPLLAVFMWGVNYTVNLILIFFFQLENKIN